MKMIIYLICTQALFPLWDGIKLTNNKSVILTVPDCKVTYVNGAGYTSSTPDFIKVKCEGEKDVYMLPISQCSVNTMEDNRVKK